MQLRPVSRVHPCSNYVLDLALSASGLHLAAALSNDAVKLFTADAAGQLKDAAKPLPATQEFVTQLSFPSAQQPQKLFVSTSQGQLKVIDIVSGQQVEGCSTDEKEIVCFAVSDKHIAAGCKGELFIWDKQSFDQLALFDDTHAEDVMQICFHPRQQHVMISASLDGLVSVFDFSDGINEDDAFKAGLNWDASVSRLGFCGANAEHLWLTSNTEGLCLWEWQAACDEEGTGGEGPLAEVHDARELLTAALAIYNAGLGLRHPIVRLLGCEQDPHTGQLLALASSERGVMAAFPISYPASGSPTGSFTFQPPAYVFEGGHDEVVRSYCWPQHGKHMCFTGSEDGFVAAWSLSRKAAGVPKTSLKDVGMTSDQSAKQKKGVKRRKPV